MAFRFFLLLLPLFLFAKPGYEAPWGKDAPLTFDKNSDPPVPIEPANIFAASIENVIKGYQKHISPLHGGRSNFRPTSSQYMFAAIRRYGFWQGYIMGCDRLLRENKDPWIYRTRFIDKKLYKWDPTYE